MEIKVGISNRHVHLTKEDKDILFGEGYELTKRNELVQPGEYACEEYKGIICPKCGEKINIK